MPRRLLQLVLASLAAVPLAAATAAGQPPSPPPPDDAPLSLTRAIGLARANSPIFRAAQTASALAAEDRKQARGNLLPNLSEFTQFIHTQENGTASGVFVANDGPNVYNSWFTVHGDLFSPQRWAEYRSAAAAEASARAKADVAARGLVATVVQNFYGTVAADRKALSARQSLDEAKAFADITVRQERGGEVAHSDVVKAQIQLAQRQRDAQDAELAALKSRLALSVLVFPDFRDTFSVIDDLENDAPLPTLDAVKAAAIGSSPDVKAAEAGVRQSESDVNVARSGILPSVSFDYFYGINANQWAITNPDGERLLGSVVQAQLNVPLWNWGAAQSRITQAHLRVDQARTELAGTQRELSASINAFFREAEISRDQIASLRESLQLATESLRLTLLRYQAGEISVLEVVDAQTTLIQARNALDDGLVRYRVALANLQTLTGTL